MIPLGFTLRACDLQKTLGYNSWTSLGLIQKVGYYGYLRAKTLPRSCSKVMDPQV